MVDTHDKTAPISERRTMQRNARRLSDEWNIKYTKALRYLERGHDVNDIPWHEPIDCNWGCELHLTKNEKQLRSKL